KIKVEQQEIFTKISIHDQGKGIALARQGLIFSRFYREPEVHDKKGIGIGLFLSREIISKQGGYIEVESEVEKGSTFIIYLLN
ncbi:sensor histidine kinase KdpD, partial [Thomasclavelia sp.]|uniref:sensor histidine kinase n=1 Tax=Thomasclavelia sp. TaxID=3025757 RepID=UPI0025CE2275